MNIITLTPDQIDLIKSGNKIEKGDEEFWCWPLWIRPYPVKWDVDKGDEYLRRFEVLTSAQLPREQSFKTTGLQKNKYIIKKSDNEPVDPAADYFVLRMDEDHHARVAVLAYAKSVQESNPQLANDLIDKIKLYEPELLLELWKTQ